MVNRWQVYSYLKRHPEVTESTIKKMFPNVSQKEVREGIREFRSVQDNNPDAVILADEIWRQGERRDRTRLGRDHPNSRKPFLNVRNVNGGYR